ncbi:MULTISPECIES: HAD family hydrolase [Vibrio]|jgi:beta-phosphoglucomutase family hydrolase|uniref:HAD family hydrolase n=1 Tax=Vibrio TaxID=662 RepID=UPI000BFF9BE1|nr:MULTISPECIES: beta-phosphoglucomutase family hydrolase [unclassified Vibrio]PHJ43329.1 carotenoid dehydrogenase [Vibrio sp. PID17_43]RIZ53706.1 carotenoid dehydrogenase [Vibrio sp. PID23_8]
MLEPNLDKYQAIIFDLDGTLINSMVAHAAAWEQTCNKFNIPYDKEWLDDLGGMPSRKVALEIIRRYALTIDPIAVTKDKIANFEAIENKGNIIPQIYNLLKEYQRSKKIGIGTGAQYRHAKEILDATDIQSRIEALVTSDDVENHKPNPDTFLRVAEKLNTDTEKCVVFEDTTIGRQAANRAGMDCYLVKHGEIIDFYPAIKTREE